MKYSKTVITGVWQQIQWSQSFSTNTAEVDQIRKVIKE
jgi:hypothetical protein